MTERNSGVLLRFRESVIQPYNILWYTLICLLTFTSCEDDAVYMPVPQISYPDYDSNPLVLYVVDEDDDHHTAYRDHVRKTMDYAKVPFNSITVKNLNRLSSIPPETRVLMIGTSDNLTQRAEDHILQFVTAGNTVIFLNALDDEIFRFLVGIKEAYPTIVNSTAKGYTFLEPLLPGLTGAVYDNNVSHFGYNKDSFLDSTKILTGAANNRNYPAILLNKIGKGQVILHNTTQPALKQDRGLYFSSILRGLEGVPYAVANVSAIHLDDFPAPLYNIIAEPIKTEYGVNQAEFYQNVWWLDHLALAEKYNIEYTAFPCFDYRGNTTPPFLFVEWERNKFMHSGTRKVVADYLMRDVVREGHELGFHGYNHQSLWLEDWSNPDFMVTSLKAANKKWRGSGYKRLPRSYVPPSNHIDSVGLQALSRGMPSLDVMSSLYLGDFEEGGNREFDPDPLNPALFDFPRITSGYEMETQEAYKHQSLFLYSGIWTHFFHPDDVFQIPTEENVERSGGFEFRNPNNLGWVTSENGEQGLLPKFENYLADTQDLFPMLQWLKNEDCADITEAWRYSSISRDFEGNCVIAQSSNSGETYFFNYVDSVRTEGYEMSLRANGSTYTTIPLLNGKLYHLKTQSSSLSSCLPLSRYEKTDPELLEVVRQAYENYLDDMPEFKTEDEKLEYFINNGMEGRAIALLQKRVRQNLDSFADWKKLQELYSWQSDDESIWRLLKNMYENTGDGGLVTLSRKLIQGSDYPNISTRKYWMELQIALKPGDTGLLMEYLAYFPKSEKYGSDDFAATMQNSSNTDQRSDLLSLIMEKDTARAVEIIGNLTPCGNLNGMAASQVAWYYADKKDFSRALAWSACTDSLEPSAIRDWRIQTGEYRFLKEVDFPKYVEYILYNMPGEARQELIDLKPCQNSGLEPYRADIAHLFAEAGAFRKALAWSACAPDFPVADRMFYMLELKDYDMLRQTYQTQLETQPNNDRAHAVMAGYYLQEGRALKAAEVINRIKTIQIRNKQRAQLNEYLLYATIDVQMDVLKNYPELIDTDLQAKINKRNRLQRGPIVDALSILVTDQLDPTSWDNSLQYGIADRKGNRHRIGVAQTLAEPIIIDINPPANRRHELYGLQYNYTSRQRDTKWNYQGIANLEYDFTDDQLFYELTAAAMKTVDSLYYSAQIFRRPAVTGPAYSLNIYQNQLTLYSEYLFPSNFQIVGTFEGNLYDDGGADGQLLAQYGYRFKIGRYGRLVPYAEAAGLLGNTDREDGFPYWTIKQRLYGGGGIAYIYEQPDSPVLITLGAAGFFDTLSGTFLRYGGSANYPITDYIWLRAGTEFFTLDNFYSNSFTLGVRYYLVPRSQ